MKAAQGEVQHTEEAVHIATSLGRVVGATGGGGAAGQLPTSRGQAAGAAGSILPLFTVVMPWT